MSGTTTREHVRQGADPTLDTPTRPDVWTIPGTGEEWCDCGQDHQIVRADVAERYAGTGRDGRVSHRTVVLVTQALWAYSSVCKFFHDNLNAAARSVAGAVQKDYLLDDAIDITGLFSKTWQGCPDENC